MKNWIWYDIKSGTMSSIAKMFFSRWKQHDVARRDCRCRQCEATTGSRWQLGDHDAAAEVDAGSLQNALS